MQIQKGKLNDNRTWRYLYPCLKIYGKELYAYLSQFIKLAVGIGDSNIETKEPCIFILIDPSVRQNTEEETMAYKYRFAKFLNWLRYQYFYKTDYVYEDLDNGEKHMIVLRLPYKYDLSYLSFVQGKYSKMYNKSEVLEYFKNISLPNRKDIETKINKKLEDTRKILTKSKTYVPVFAKLVNEKFDTDNPDTDFYDAELDFPPNLEEEVFNYIEEYET